MLNYELVVVLDGKATSAKKKAITEKIEKLVSEQKGKIGKAKELGVKELAYKIGKSLTGLYLLFPLELDGEGAKQFLGKIRLEEELIRYLLTRKGTRLVGESR